MGAERVQNAFLAVGSLRGPDSAQIFRRSRLLGKGVYELVKIYRRTRPGSVKGEGAAVFKTGFREGEGVKTHARALRSSGGQQAFHFLQMWPVDLEINTSSVLV